MKHRNFRLDDETWFAFSRLAELYDQRVSDRARDLLRRDVARHRKELDSDPAWQERLRKVRETGEW
jgi:predicted transcriptional regulator